MKTAVTPTQTQQFKCVSWHSFLMATGFPKLIFCCTHWFCCGHPNQAGMHNTSHLHLSIIVWLQEQWWETSLRINTYLRLEKGQCKMCSYSLLPFHLGLPPAFEEAGAGDKRSFCRERWDRPLPHVHSFRGQVAPSPGGSATSSSPGDTLA